MFKYLLTSGDVDVFGTSRRNNLSEYFVAGERKKIITGVDVENQDSLVNALARVSPDVVINCVGLVKQLDASDDPLQAVPINTLLPHRLASLCQLLGARLIHVSTDCVFSGTKGGYVESDFPDAYDLYGRTKLLGEVDYPNAVTLRTSIIGHELSGQRSLIGWFLSQEGEVKGFTRAVFSGLPTVELARVVRDFVLPNKRLTGLYHVAASPINKFDLLQLVASVYNKNINIIPADEMVIDRSLQADRFKTATGYIAPEWPELISFMYKFHNS